MELKGTTTATTTTATTKNNTKNVFPSNINFYYQNTLKKKSIFCILLGMINDNRQITNDNRPIKFYHIK